jgi:glycerol uptake facilitator protein
MNIFIAEFIGTMLLILLGNGVVANVCLDKTKGNSGGWLLITVGWGMAVFVGVFVGASMGGGHLNPAVTISFAARGMITWGESVSFIAGQMAGAAFGAFLVWLHHKPHYDATEDSGAILGTFSTGPAIRSTLYNLIAEIIGTFVLVFAGYYILSAKVGDTEATLGALDALPIALVVLVIGISLGGTTGYAINPARDLAPRIMHTILPIPNKGSSDWSYSWIPIVGPLIGGLLAAWVAQVL